MSEHGTMPAALLERLYRQHQQPALRRLRRSLGGQPAQAAEDALADAWVILARKPASYLHSDGAELTGWLVKVARRIALNDKRLRVRTELLQLDTLPEETGISLDAYEETVARMELREMREQLDTLTEGQRLALTGRLLGLSYDQLAAATGRTYTNINRHITEGRAALRARGIDQ